MNARELSEPLVVLPAVATLDACRAAFADGARWVGVGDGFLADVDLAGPDPRPRALPTVPQDAGSDEVFRAMQEQGAVAVTGAVRIVTEQSLLKGLAAEIPMAATVEPKDVVTSSVSTTRAAALETMKSAGIRHLVLTESDGHWLGVVSMRDLALASEKVEIAAEMIRGSASYWVAPGTLVVDACRLMVQQEIGCLPIVDAGSLVGILTRRDVLDVLARELGGVP